MKTIVKFFLRFIGMLMTVWIAAVLFSSPVWADGSAPTISLTDISKSIGTAVSSLATILSDVALLAGIGFVLAAFFKFHQHKQNPTQVPISQGVTLLLIGAGLVIFPTLITLGPNIITGKSNVNKIGGSELKTIIGGGGNAG